MERGAGIPTAGSLLKLLTTAVTGLDQNWELGIQLRSPKWKAETQLLVPSLAAFHGVQQWETGSRCGT